MPQTKTRLGGLPRHSPAHRRLGFVCALAIAGSVGAAPFSLIEFTHDGGGQHSQGARFAIEGTIGQPDAGRLQGQRFAIEGGFWRPGTGASGDSIFRNSFED